LELIQRPGGRFISEGEPIFPHTSPKDVRLSIKETPEDMIIDVYHESFSGA
jgi:hypothetical protein